MKKAKLSNTARNRTIRYLARKAVDLEARIAIARDGSAAVHRTINVWNDGAEIQTGVCLNFSSAQGGDATTFVEIKHRREGKSTSICIELNDIAPLIEALSAAELALVRIADQRDNPQNYPSLASLEAQCAGLDQVIAPAEQHSHIAGDQN